MTLIIGSRYNGPPGSANGGYAAGLFAAAGLPDEGAVQVTLRLPPPLEVPLRVGPPAPGRTGVALRSGDGTVIAEAQPAPPPTEPVPAVSWAEAVEVSASYPGFTDHPFPTCYVCGPDHPNGLRIFPGALDDGRTAAPFVVPEDPTSETVWAALDCPGGWAVLTPGRPYVLGRMTVAVTAVPAAGDRCVVVGRMHEARGRKAEVSTSLYGPDGGLLGCARATWISI
jgi:hypothetical protein